MDTDTLKLAYEKLNNTLEFLKEDSNENKNIAGMELAAQLVFDMYLSKEYNHREF